MNQNLRDFDFGGGNAATSHIPDSLAGHEYRALTALVDAHSWANSPDGYKRYSEDDWGRLQYWLAKVVDNEV